MPQRAKRSPDSGFSFRHTELEEALEDLLYAGPGGFKAGWTLSRPAFFILPTGTGAASSPAPSARP
ncbi:MAG: DUF1731 domain-containing protein [Dehalococcoidia bacterium]|nr:DUF1731 domain-containing protein [Dehalococcoidia bacterium]